VVTAPSSLQSPIDLVRQQLCEVLLLRLRVVLVHLAPDVGLAHDHAVEAEPWPHKEILDQILVKADPLGFDLAPLELVGNSVNHSDLHTMLGRDSRDVIRKVAATVPGHPERSESVEPGSVHAGLVAGDEPRANAWEDERWVGLVVLHPVPSGCYSSEK
jgi:hypothetical protein